MSKRPGIRFGWFTWMLYLALAFATLVLESVNYPSWLLPNIFNALVLLAFATVGALIASRRPENPIGWLMCVGTLFWAAGTLALQYATYALVKNPSALPGGDWVAMIGASLRGLGFGILLTYVLLLFPDGHLPSPRWLPAVWFAIAIQALFILAAWVAPGPEVDRPIAFVRSPFRVPIDSTTLESLAGLILLASAISMVVCAGSVFMRFRRAQGDERQQLKWFAYAALLAIVVVMIILLLPVFQVNPQLVNSALFSLAVVGFPVAIGIAILKYRLYDIDILIRRTLVYGVLTGLLAIFYLGSVIILQKLFQGVTGQGSELAIILSTLAIAVLFNPLRRRVQDLIDRRFYRRKYDAVQVLTRFGQTARDKVDLDELTNALVNVVNDTVQPTHVSVWLRRPVETAHQRSTR